MILLFSLHCLYSIPYAPILIPYFPDLPIDFLLHPTDPLSNISNLLVHSLLTLPNHLVDPPVEVDLRESQGHLSRNSLLHQVYLGSEIVLQAVEEELEGV